MGKPSRRRDGAGSSDADASASGSSGPVSLYSTFKAGVGNLDDNQIWFIKLSAACLVLYLVAFHTPAWVLRLVWGLIILAYFIPHLYASFGSTQNLATRYASTGPAVDKKWAFVSGASSGIGLAIAKSLANDGINVVIAAIPDQLLDDAVDHLTAEYGPKGVHVRKCPVNLGKGDGSYMDEIEKCTSDIDVQLVYNNAGFIVTGFFHKTPLEKWMANLECNATAQVRITYHFVTKMVDKSLKGAVVFTSSAAACMPSPFASIYGSSKAFLSAFAQNIATELKPKGIDVCVIHPSPVASRFYDKADKIDLMDFFKQFSVEADELPSEFSKAVGRSVWKDVGPTAIIFRFVSKLIDLNFMGLLMGVLGKHLPDYKRYA